MKDFLFIYRRGADDAVQPSAEQMQAMMKPWQDWMSALDAQQKLVTAGNRLVATGKVVKPKNMVTDGPYMEMKEAVGGYTVVRAAGLDEATALAQGCPILLAGGNVEVRELVPMEYKAS